jgi:hypothetical protein
MNRLICTAALVATASFSVQGAIVFSGSGNNPEVSATASGSASFSIAGNILTLVLTNTTAPRTSAQGNALTGVTFDITPGSPVLTLTSTAITAGSLLWNSKTSSTAAASLAGSWTNVLGGSPLGEYGVASTGFNNRFNGGSISLGNSSPNYGIVAAGTFDGTNSVAFGGSQFPFIQNSMTFTFSGVSGISESQIANVKLLFGTDGTGVVNTLVPAPAPALLGLAGLLGVSRRRR